MGDDSSVSDPGPGPRNARLTRFFRVVPRSEPAPAEAPQAALLGGSAAAGSGTAGTAAIGVAATAAGEVVEDLAAE